MSNSLSELRIEDFIWTIYIFIAIFSMISNYYEKRFYFFKIYQDKQKYRFINVAILEVAIIIYLYFLYNRIKHANDNKYSYLAIFASTLFVIAGAIMLYTEFKSGQDDDIGII